jgi:hypothetical protein
MKWTGFTGLNQSRPERAVFRGAAGLTLPATAIRGASKDIACCYRIWIGEDAVVSVTGGRDGKIGMTAGLSARLFS